LAGASIPTIRRHQPVAEIGSVGPAATPDDNTNGNTNGPTNAVTVTNAAASSDTNATAISDTSAVATQETNAAGESITNTNAAGTLGTNVAVAPETKSSRKSTNAHLRVSQAANITAPAPDASEARGAMITYLAAFIGSVIGLGLLIAYDVTQIVGTQAVDFLFNDAGEGQRDPEYERAEAEWANGKFLDAIQLMRDFLKKHPRELYAALRIAEIYEKDLKNPLAAALEYEEVLKHKLPAERWGWAAIHLCNLYSRLNQSDKAMALLRRVADEYPKTGAAKKVILAGMNLLPFEPQPPYRPRAFVPGKMDLGDWNQVAPLFDKLEAAAASARTPAELERWLLDGGELTAALDEESSRRYIAMTCHTDNAEAEKAYLHFVEEIEPRSSRGNSSWRGFSWPIRRARLAQGAIFCF
jgi:TolA-binding protein